MRLELGTLLRDLATLGQAEDLIAAAVSQDRAVPTDEAMQSAAARDQVIPGTEVQVIGVAEDDLRACILEILEKRPLHGTLRADRHEGWRAHDAVRRLELAEAGTAVSAQQPERKGIGSHLIRTVPWLDVGRRERPQQMTPDPLYYGSQA